MKKNIFSLIAIAVIGTSTCMAKATPKPIHSAKPRMEHKAVMPPTTTTVTTTTIKPNGTKVITTTTTKTVRVAPPAKHKMVKPHKPHHPTYHKHHMHHKHHRGTCKACRHHGKHFPKKQLQRSIYSSSPHQVKTLAYGGEIFSAIT